ncbi:helix-turn-helix transcriptional regulator [Kocuria sp. CCUG 69068]|uniref:helix-turn-helix transcriptional regulator n=1 Tax=Kocuria sp. CCUG 69068 TaxID=2043138 RepID=UPI001E464A7A
MMTTHRRRAQAKGRWMQLIDPKILQAHMTHRKITQARLASYVGCSRQFIHSLLIEDKYDKAARRSCTPDLARRIEEVLNVPSGAIFVPKKSTEMVPTAHARRSKPVAA